MDNLKPCPFCGSAAHNIGKGRLPARCRNPKCPIFCYSFSLEDWNTRPREDALTASFCAEVDRMGARIAELEDALQRWLGFES